MSQPHCSIRFSTVQYGSVQINTGLEHIPVIEESLTDQPLLLTAPGAAQI